MFAIGRWFHKIFTKRSRLKLVISFWNVHFMTKNCSGLPDVQRIKVDKFEQFLEFVVKTIIIEATIPIYYLVKFEKYWFCTRNNLIILNYPPLRFSMNLMFSKLKVSEIEILSFYCFCSLRSLTLINLHYLKFYKIHKITLFLRLRH